MIIPLLLFNGNWQMTCYSLYGKLIISTLLFSVIVTFTALASKYAFSSRMVEY